MSSLWKAQHDALLRARCEPCQGLGEVNDAEVGDVMFNTWPCTACKGTGYADQPKAAPAPPEGLPREFQRG